MAIHVTPKMNHSGNGMTILNGGLGGLGAGTVVGGGGGNTTAFPQSMDTSFTQQMDRTTGTFPHVNRHMFVGGGNAAW